ncbi:hypothetical protein [Streptantibioticus silvisoli]|uniref:Uncharacterized protein n=1 Tax=Streptantibioticus silvisoli TaxID=2705255 RepID=A0ABT6W505_9ACTN|nr:hypothetical protein [Streptantibioticus silvisoli]MDI5965754.1 hypothetical protein [Streptantibioticus silvisoli]
MAATTATPSKRTAKKPAKRPATRAAVAKRPSRHTSPAERFASWLGRRIARHAKAHHESVRSRKDAAILRITHEGCQTCGGLGVITKRDKDGSFAGSKTCPAKPREVKVSKLRIHAAARAGVDKRSGLLGWRCPCGKSQKPRHHDDKTATKALRTHEQEKHGGRPMGGGLVMQLPEGVDPTNLPAPAKTASLTKTNTAAAPKTDLQWLAQNSRITPAAARKKGLCGDCGGTGALYTLDSGTQTTTVCAPCNGRGKAAKAS